MFIVLAVVVSSITFGGLGWCYGRAYQAGKQSIDDCK